MIGYAYARYLSNPHKARSQTGYVFTYGGTLISWRSVKQTLVATSSNHLEILAIHEASRECVWLMIQHIQETCGLSFIRGNATVLHEDNVACIVQMKGWLKKGDRTKHIPPKFFYTRKLQKKCEIDVQQIQSCNNLADLFTKTLPLATLKKLRYDIGMWRLRDLPIEVLKKSWPCLHERENTNMDILHSFFLHPGFVPLGFTSKVFNEAVCIFLWSSKKGVL